MNSMRQRYPESMAFVDLLNVTGDGLRTIWFALLAYMTFLALAIIGTSHRDLFLEAPKVLPPPISVDIDLVGFYVVAPLILLFLHIFLLIKLSIFSTVYEDFEEQVRKDIPLASERKQVRKHLNTTVFLRTLSAWKTEQRTNTPNFWLMTILLASSTIILPSILILLSWIWFLPYQDTEVTMIHRFIFAFDASAILMSLQIRSKLKRRSLWVALALFVTAAGSIFTFPQDCISLSVKICLDRNPIFFSLGFGRTLRAEPYPYDLPENALLALQEHFYGGFQTTSLSWPPTSLNLAGEDFTTSAESNRSSGDGYVHSLAGRSFVGIDLRSTNLEGTGLLEANLAGANLHGARLSGADLSSAVLTGADLRETDLESANLDSAHAQGAFFSGAKMQGASLKWTSLEGALFDNTQLQGSNFQEARLLGSNFRSASLQGANLEAAKLESASFQDAQMQGASLRDSDARGGSFFATSLQGATLVGADLSHAYFLESHLQGAVFRESNISGAIYIGAEFWRTDGSSMKGIAFISNPTPKRLRRPMSEILAWVNQIPTLNLRKEAERRFEIMFAEDIESIDERMFQPWLDRDVSEKNVSSYAIAEEERYRASSSRIIEFFCKEIGSAAAFLAMLHGIFSERSNMEKSKIISDVIDCRTNGRN